MFSSKESDEHLIPSRGLFSLNSAHALDSSSHFNLVEIDFNSYSDGTIVSLVSFVKRT